MVGIPIIYQPAWWRGDMEELDKRMNERQSIVDIRTIQQETTPPEACGRSIILA